MLVTAVLAEAAVRIYESAAGKDFSVAFAAGLNMSELLYQPHPYIGYDLRPGAESRPGRDPFRVNSRGFRGAEFDALPQQGTLRVACVGGSTTWGTGCSGDDTTWPALLQVLLNKALPEDGPYQRVEVINAGVSGYTLMESFIHLKMRVLPLRPHVVVVYHGINDARVITRNTFRPDYAHVRHSWRVPVPATSDILFGWSRVYGWLRGGAGALPDLQDFVYAEDLEQQAGLQNIDPGAANYARTLHELIAIARVSDCQPMLATQAYTRRLPNKNEWMLTYGFHCLDRLNQETTAVAERQGVPLVDLREAVGEAPRLYADPVHLNDAGNGIVAYAIARSMVDSGLLRPTEPNGTSMSIR